MISHHCPKTADSRSIANMHNMHDKHDKHDAGPGDNQGNRVKKFVTKH
jgi:hypothetical protein